jgi:hypothetical protein
MLSLFRRIDCEQNAYVSYKEFIRFICPVYLNPQKMILAHPRITSHNRCKKHIAKHISTMLDDARRKSKSKSRSATKVHSKKKSLSKTLQEGHYRIAEGATQYPSAVTHSQAGHSKSPKLNVIFSTERGDLIRSQAPPALFSTFDLRMKRNSKGSERKSADSSEMKLRSCHSRGKRTLVFTNDREKPSRLYEENSATLRADWQENDRSRPVIAINEPRVPNVRSHKIDEGSSLVMDGLYGANSRVNKWERGSYNFRDQELKIDSTHGNKYFRHDYGRSGHYHTETKYNHQVNDDNYHETSQSAHQDTSDSCRTRDHGSVTSTVWSRLRKNPIENRELDSNHNRELEENRNGLRRHGETSSKAENQFLSSSYNLSIPIIARAERKVVQTKKRSFHDTLGTPDNRSDQGSSVDSELNVMTIHDLATGLARPKDITTTPTKSQRSHRVVSKESERKSSAGYLSDLKERAREAIEIARSGSLKKSNSRSRSVLKVEYESKGAPHSELSPSKQKIALEISQEDIECFCQVIKITIVYWSNIEKIKSDIYNEPSFNLKLLVDQVDTSKKQELTIDDFRSLFELLGVGMSRRDMSRYLHLILKRPGLNELILYSFDDACQCIHPMDQDGTVATEAKDPEDHFGDKVTRSVKEKFEEMVHMQMKMHEEIQNLLRGFNYLSRHSLFREISSGNDRISWDTLAYFLTSNKMKYYEPDLQFVFREFCTESSRYIEESEFNTFFRLYCGH